MRRALDLWAMKLWEDDIKLAWEEAAGLRRYNTRPPARPPDDERRAPARGLRYDGMARSVSASVTDNCCVGTRNPSVFAGRQADHSPLGQEKMTKENARRRRFGIRCHEERLTRLRLGAGMKLHEVIVLHSSNATVVVATL